MEDDTTSADAWKNGGGLGGVSYDWFDVLER